VVEAFSGIHPKFEIAFGFPERIAAAKTEVAGLQQHEQSNSIRKAATYHSKNRTDVNATLMWRQQAKLRFHAECGRVFCVPVALSSILL
jgi:hypothetical protein